LLFQLVVFTLKVAVFEKSLFTLPSQEAHQDT
jgi:hypothetical protein